MKLDKGVTIYYSGRTYVNEVPDDITKRKDFPKGVGKVDTPPSKSDGKKNDK